MFYKEGVGENTAIHVKLFICVNLFKHTPLQGPQENGRSDSF